MGAGMKAVLLASAIKNGGKWHKSGAIIEVTAEDAVELERLGLVASYETTVTASAGVDLRRLDLVDLSTSAHGETLVTATQAEIDAQIARQAKSLADAALDSVVSEACRAIIAERDTAVEGLENMARRAEKLEADLMALQLLLDAKEETAGGSSGEAPEPVEKAAADISAPPPAVDAKPATKRAAKA